MSRLLQELDRQVPLMDEIDTKVEDTTQTPFPFSVLVSCNLNFLNLLTGGQSNLRS